jgi:predicted nucleic acid-binding protein
MSGNKALLDTNVIIFASKHQIDIGKLLSSYDFFYTSIVSFMEVYGHTFARQEEKDLIDDLFENLEIVDVNQAIAKQVIVYRKNRAKKIKLPDAIILATARYLDAELVTDDWDDFKNIDNQVTIQKLDDFKF